ncbi:peptidoglycan DD-metalloendopeptidase family protein [Streptomyces sp. RS10V-4]|uniref:M23 family metallopeptidase n=1 Tax=Streptomyces rhizoryzae TaxID=2932493 RepID=UPI0020062D79|nr:M23 family metallopeptidase [Streptomyces rhizoryzae]MCK7622930.1 peptidoglycan DD-metalloendopeptidase family protein [Streptomyces rhizoryzae]
MDDRHPSGAQLPTAPASDASRAHAPAYGDDDPLFGAHPGGYDQGPYVPAGHSTDAYATGSYPTTGYDTGYGTPSYDTAGYDTAAYGAPGYDPYAHTAYDAPAYGTPAYDGPGYGGDGTAAYGTGHGSAAYGTGAYGSGAGYDGGSGADFGAPDTGYDGGGAAYGTGVHASATGAAYGDGSGATAPYDTGGYPAAAYGTDPYGTGYGAPAHDGAAFAAAATVLQEPVGYEATAVWSTTDYADAPVLPADLAPGIPAQAGPPADDTVVWDALPAAFAGADQEGGREGAGPAEGSGSGPASIADAMTQAMPITAVPDEPVPDEPAPAARRSGGAAAGKAVRGGSRGRRRQAKRSALLTVAVPSVAAMGVCAAAAASVSQFGGDTKDEAAHTAPDAGAAKRTTAANKKLDSQLAGLSASAQDFRERASRTQERLDLKERQEQERKRKAEEAARKEAMRPKFVLPVTQHGLSALFGQAGMNWMSVHTGIDFPVDTGTPVRAATDGTVRTKWNSAYGNMAIVTAPDGTETWYCHLSSTRIRSGTVKAGDTIAYSGDSGNSTGPHLHFEVRPGGGAAVDPLPWLRSHGLNPY